MIEWKFTPKIILFLLLIFISTFLLPSCTDRNSGTGQIDGSSEKVTDSGSSISEKNFITLHYHERIPYSYSTENGIEGIIASIVDTAFKRAGVPFIWKKTPSNRQLQTIKDNKNYDGIIGWFKNPERESFSRFSHFIYQDKPYIAVARSDNSRIRNTMTIEDILSDKNLTLEIKDGYSYGSFIDGKIEELNPNVDSTTMESIQMLQKIHLKRADYFFIAPEEADNLIKISGLPIEDFKYIRFSNMPEGEKRYIMFSEKVNPSIINKINREIVKLNSDN